jgi:hypothetical protein
MALKDTVQKMTELLGEMSYDLKKACEGNRAAAQRVRTCSIRFAKLSKVYRKESVLSEKKGSGKKMKAKPQPARKAVMQPVLPAAASPARRPTAKLIARRR